ncbi:hypothetical protein QCA50_008153 [Cerrena zonata]|uniref:tyrosinase n=1 Tax=Cerrena zonata TaxID=2478898 RepID=A0AAW0GI35_9APHY
MSPIITTGPTVGGVCTRLEITDLVKNKKQFSLFIQALCDMQGIDLDGYQPIPVATPKTKYEDNQDDPLSFFQISGIHGLPPVAWDNSGGKGPTSTRWKGYCTHGTVLFPTWHRPYVALFEQVLQKTALEIVEKYKYGAEWVKAATELRCPYWDWASPDIASPPEEVISKETIEIEIPSGSMTIKNPLFSYHFHRIHPSFNDSNGEGPVFNKWENTLRHPKSTTDPNTESDVVSLITSLSAEHGNIREQVGRMFTIVDWASFSHHASDKGKDKDSDNTTKSSLEAIHDNIHVFVGHGGHMGYPDYAGFDPIFFLHHANVDRMLALWIGLNPQFELTPGPSEKGTWTIEEDILIDKCTNLTPFRRSQDPTDYWKSYQILSTEKFGYTYPDFAELSSQDPKYKEKLQARIFHLYPVPQVPGIPNTLTPFHDWTIRIRVKKFELGGSFRVLFFLTTEDVGGLDISHPAYVGSYSVFASAAIDYCSNCRNQADAGTVIQGFVHLNRKIDALGLVSSADFHPVDIVGHLSQSLKWRVEKDNGIRVDPPSSLEITVSSSELTQHLGEIVPRLRETRFHPEITRGRLGGFRQEGNV